MTGQTVPEELCAVVQLCPGGDPGAALRLAKTTDVVVLIQQREQLGAAADVDLLQLLAEEGRQVVQVLLLAQLQGLQAFVIVAVQPDEPGILADIQRPEILVADIQIPQVCEAFDALQIPDEANDPQVKLQVIVIHIQVLDGLDLRGAELAIDGPRRLFYILRGTDVKQSSAAKA